MLIGANFFNSSILNIQKCCIAGNMLPDVVNDLLEKVSVCSLNFTLERYYTLEP